MALGPWSLPRAVSPIRLTLLQVRGKGTTFPPLFTLFAGEIDQIEFFGSPCEGGI